MPESKKKKKKKYKHSTKEGKKTREKKAKSKTAQSPRENSKEVKTILCEKLKDPAEGLENKNVNVSYGSTRNFNDMEIDDTIHHNIREQYLNFVKERPDSHISLKEFKDLYTFLRSGLPRNKAKAEDLSSQSPLVSPIFKCFETLNSSTSQSLGKLKSVINEYERSIVMSAEIECVFQDKGAKLAQVNNLVSAIEDQFESNTSKLLSDASLEINKMNRMQSIILQVLEESKLSYQASLDIGHFKNKHEGRQSPRYNEEGTNHPVNRPKVKFDSLHSTVKFRRSIVSPQTLDKLQKGLSVLSNSTSDMVLEKDVIDNYELAGKQGKAQFLGNIDSNAVPSSMLVYRLLEERQRFEKEKRGILKHINRLKKNLNDVTEQR